MSIRPRIIEEPTPAAALSVQPTLAAQLAGAIPKEPPVSRPPPCLGGGGCDKRPIRYIREKIRGPVCDAIGAPVNQLPGNECPIERQERLAKHVLQFVTDEWVAASDIARFATENSATSRLEELLAAGKVEMMRDENIGVNYWRLARDKGFHRASDEVK